VYTALVQHYYMTLCSLFGLRDVKKNIFEYTLRLTRLPLNPPKITLPQASDWTRERRPVGITLGVERQKIVRKETASESC
jgi:hypothetical protein